MVRRNGCVPPFHPLQVTSWFFITFFSAAFFLLKAPILPLGANVVFLVIPGLLFFLTLFLMIKVTLTNPCDSNVILETRKANIGVVVPEGQHVIDDQNFCMLCRVNVNKRSKHCRLCDKCIGTFDHHCIWINNCVGDKNYKSLLTVFLFDVLRSFFTFVGLLFLLVIVDLTIGASLVIEFIVDMSRITTQLHDIYGENFPKYLWVSIVGVFIILDLPAIYLLGQLFFFHVNIGSPSTLFIVYDLQAFFKHITTYDFIVMQRAKAEEMEKRPQPPPSGARLLCSACRKDRIAPKDLENPPTSEPEAASQQETIVPPAAPTVNPESQKPS